MSIFRLEKDDGIAIVTMNDPSQAQNVLNDEIQTEFEAKNPRPPKEGRSGNVSSLPSPIMKKTTTSTIPPLMDRRIKDWAVNQAK